MGMRKRNRDLARPGLKKAAIKRAHAKIKRALKGPTAGQKLHAKMHGKKA